MNQILSFLAKYKWWIIGALVALIVLPRIFKFITSAASGSDSPPVGGGSSPQFKCNPASADRGKMFGLGTKKSNEVCYLQTWLNTYYGAGLSVDGDFGAKTRSALDTFKPGAGITMSLNTLNI